MNRTPLARIRLAATLIAGLAMAPLAHADGGIVKCIGPAGKITFTDSACDSGERSVTLIAAPKAVANAVTTATDNATASLAAPPSAARTAAMVYTRLPTRPALGRLDPPSRSLARDVMTLKAARQAMLLMDGAAGAMRNSRVAGLQ